MGAIAASFCDDEEGGAGESSISASVDEGGEGTFSSSSPGNLFEEGSPLTGMEERVLIAARTLLSILSESSSTTTTTTPSPTAASTLAFEDVDDVTLESYINELLEENNLFNLPLSSDTLNTTTTTTTAAPEVKTEVEVPDWNDVHQQGEELHMRPYQRRFENRPLETRVLLLDPDTSHISLGDDEAIGREIAIKREPSSEDEEEMGIHWEDAHRMNVRTLRERNNVEVPERIRRKGARIALDGLVVSEPSSSLCLLPSSSSSSSASSPSSLSEEEKEDVRQ